jgi:hypothetical protein
MGVSFMRQGVCPMTLIWPAVPAMRIAVYAYVTRAACMTPERRRDL